MTRMPVLFIGHGSPMNALERTASPTHGARSGETSPAARAARRLGALVFGATAVTAMPRPRTIHDSTASRRSCSTSTIRPR